MPICESGHKLRSQILGNLTNLSADDDGRDADRGSDSSERLVDLGGHGGSRSSPHDARVRDGNGMFCPCNYCFPCPILSLGGFCGKALRQWNRSAGSR
jgi:hypothetical protein